MARGFSTIVETASIVASTLTEVLASTVYGNIPSDVVRVIEEFGVFGDITAGNYYSFYNDDAILALQSAIHLATVSRDNVASTKHPAKPGSTLRLYIWTTVAGRFKIWLKGKDFKLDELME